MTRLRRSLFPPPVAAAALLALTLAGPIRSAAVPAAAATGDPVNCVKPLIPPDRWDDTNGNGVFDVGDFYDPVLTGYTADDAGLQITLHMDGTPGPSAPGLYYVVDLPPLGQATEPLTGEDALRAALSECSPYPVAAGDSLLLEPGLLATAVAEEVQAVIDSDPVAAWNETTGRVEGSIFAVSPRLFRFPFMDPGMPPTIGRAYVKAVKIGVLFVESVTSTGVLTCRFASADATPVERTTWGRLRWRFGTRIR
jgi:hypothetical protein